MSVIMILGALDGPKYAVLLLVLTRFADRIPKLAITLGTLISAGISIVLLTFRKLDPIPNEILKPLPKIENCIAAFNSTDLYSHYQLPEGDISYEVYNDSSYEVIGGVFSLRWVYWISEYALL